VGAGSTGSSGGAGSTGGSGLGGGILLCYLCHHAIHVAERAVGLYVVHLPGHNICAGGILAAGAHFNLRGSLAGRIEDRQLGVQFGRAHRPHRRLQHAAPCRHDLQHVHVTGVVDSPAGAAHLARRQRHRRCVGIDVAVVVNGSAGELEHIAARRSGIAAGQDVVLLV